MIKYIIIIIIIILIIISIYFIMTKPSPNLHREILRTASGLNKLRNKFIRSAKKIVNVSVRSKEPSLKSLDDFARIFLGYGGVFKIAARMGTLSARELSVKLDILPEDLRKWLHEALINGILEKTRTPHGFIKYTINITAVRTALVKLFNNITRLFSIEEISGEALKERILINRHSCYNCPVACKRETKTKNKHGDGPEYETIINLGSMILVKTIEDVAELNYMANEMGIDTISLGGTLACACELSELGKLPEKIEWGNKERFEELIIKIAKREGIGNDLAEGSKRLAEKYGVPEAAMQVKGLEVPAYDPRGAFGMALSYGTSYRGACHLRGWAIAFEVIGIPNLVDRFSPVEKPALVAYLQDLAMVYDSLVLCQHYGMEFDEEPLAAILSAVTGVEYTKESVLQVGERIWNLARLINIKRGFGKRDDMLPKRFLEPLKEGPSKGKIIPYEEMLLQYYEVRGWDQEGVPKPEKLEELGLVEGG